MASTLTVFRKNGTQYSITIATSVLQNINLNNSPAQIASDVWSTVLSQSDPFTLAPGVPASKGDIGKNVVT
jgi:hypothetical protein